MDETRAPEGRIGLVQGSALYIAAVLGTGILVLPGLAADAAGPGSVLAVLAVLVLSVPLAGTFAVLAARYPDSGGVATFVRMALGNTAARITGYLFFFGVIIGAPVVGITAGRYFASIFGGDQAVVVIVALIVLALPFASNAGGVRVSGRVQVVLTGLLLATVVLVVLLAVPQADLGNFDPLLPRGWLGVGVAISLLVWAFSGWEAVTHLAAEFRNPQRTIPIATAIAVVAVGAGYLGLQMAVIAVLGPRAGGSRVPVLSLVSVTAPVVGAAIVTAIALVVTLGVLNTYTGAFAKLGASLGRDGDLPRWFARGAEAGGIPRRSLLLTAAVQALYFVACAITGFTLTPFILLNTACMVCVYAFGMVAALRLLPRFSLGWWFAVVSTVLVAGLLVLAGPALIAPAVFVAIGLAVAFAKRRRHAPVPSAL